MDTEIVALIEDLTAQLRHKGQSPAAIAPLLGTIRRTSRSAAYVTPSDTRYERIIVTRHRDTGVVKGVELVLAENTSVDIEGLIQRYGDYTTPPRVDWRAPERIVLAIDADERDASGDRCCDLDLIVAFRRAPNAPIENATVESITVLAQ